MIQIAIASDLHIELSKREVPLPLFNQKADVIVLAGDITNRYRGTKNKFVQTFAALRRQYHQPIIYIPGNHEYYGSDIDTLDKEVECIAKDYDISWLQKSYVDIQHVRFFGCTLWSHFLLNGEVEMPWAIKAAQGVLADYRAIEKNNETIRATETRRLFYDHIDWLTTALSQCPKDKQAVVCTHFAPHKECLHPEFDGDELSPYFVNDLGDFIEEHAPAAWIFGHTHHNVDFEAGSTRVVSNQKGYLREKTAFDPSKVIAV